MADDKRAEELLNALGLISFTKSRLPLGMRCWANELGLYVQEHKAGKWTRLQAGGSFRICFDPLQEEGKPWSIKKFDAEIWEQRFAHLIRPTYDIVTYLIRRQGYVWSANSGA